MTAAADDAYEVIDSAAASIRIRIEVSCVAPSRHPCMFVTESTLHFYISDCVL